MHAAYIKCELILIEILHGIFVLLKIHVRLLELVNQKMWYKMVTIWQVTASKLYILLYTFI